MLSFNNHFCVKTIIKCSVSVRVFIVMELVHELIIASRIRYSHLGVFPNPIEEPRGERFGGVRGRWWESRLVRSVRT